MFRALRAAAALALALASPIALAAQTDQDGAIKKLSLEGYLDMESVSGPRISPDGRQIVYTRGWVDKVNDKRESSIWIMNADGTRNRFLVDGSGPVWSPDGTRIAYTAEGEPQGTQIFVRWMDDEGAVTQVTRVEKAPSGLAWSPDGRWIAFGMTVDDQESWGIRLPGRPEGAKWTAEPRIVTRADYRQDRQGFTDDGWRHVFVVPAEGGTPRQLTDGKHDHGTAVWTPDGKELLFSGLRTGDELAWRESEIYAVDVASGAIRQLTTRKGPDNNPLPSPDGKLIAYVGDDYHEDTYRDAKIYVMGRDGSSPRVISGDLDRPTGDLIWASDGSGLYFTVSDAGSSNTHFVAVGGGVRKVTEGIHILGISSLSTSGTLVGTRSTPREPADVVAFDVRRPGDIRRLTNVNEDVLAGVTLGDVEEIWYGSLDDYRIQGWIVKPPDFDPSKKYPLMLSIHGGPHAMYGVGFSYEWQEHAANGYVVLYTNPRGSTGYGSAFANAINNAYPSKDFDDLMKGVDVVLGKGFVDEQKMYVYGCSGGGVLTSWTVGHTDRFAAASADCPVINWLSFVGTTDSPGWYRNFDRLPWEDPSEHLRRSPLMYVGNVKTPTMLMTGVLDLRTPMPQTEEYYQALKMEGVPTAMIRFNNEWHGTSSTPSNFLRTQLYHREWFQRWSKKPGVSQ
ncbi:MAG TPA: S9 family peptidase [Longimicrobiales bacterium]|nr:S9 family peptidase [Longimicrobiales bacterium]